MQMIEIINQKGAEVVTAAVDDTVQAVSMTLKKNRIGAVVVLDGSGRIAGIISERDIVHGVADQGATVLAKPVAELMTREVATCAPQSTVEELMDQMVVGRIRHLPVVDGDKLVGIVSVSDIVKNGLIELRSIKDALQDYIGEATSRSLDE